MKAKFESYSRDLFWSAFVAGATIRWSGYNDDFWWNNVAPTDDFQVREHVGKKYRLNPRTNEITLVGDQPTPPTEVPEGGPASTKQEWANAAADEIYKANENWLGDGGTLSVAGMATIILRHAPSPASTPAPQATGGTPETDAAEEGTGQPPGPYRRVVPADFARQLELQRDEAIKAHGVVWNAVRKAATSFRWLDIPNAHAELKDEAAAINEAVKLTPRWSTDWAIISRSDLATLRADLEKAKAELRALQEQNGLQLAACDCAAMMDTQATHASNSDVVRGNPAWSPAFDSVMRRTAECIDLRAKLTAANAQLAEAKEHLKDFVRDVRENAFGEWGSGKNEDDILERLTALRQQLAEANERIKGAGVGAQEAQQQYRAYDLKIMKLEESVDRLNRQLALAQETVADYDWLLMHLAEDVLSCQNARGQMFLVQRDPDGYRDSIRAARGNGGAKT